jgi:UDP-N-acetylmuramoyl-tripeptide--D-alanyl-D-alanine ligase
MISAQLSEAAAAIAGTLHGPDASFRGISTDSRGVQPGELFFALRGARGDGATYVAEVARLGAAAAVVPAPQALDLPQVVVADTRVALGALARFWRACFSVPLVGVTGSNGKTTVKEMTAAILRAAFGAHQPMALGDADPVLMTWGNLNNEIGLPRTLLYMDATHRAAVIEMGAARSGDIAYLADIAAPTVGVVTNAARAHLQGFGSIEEVAATKGELFAALPAEATAVVNRDDRFFQSWMERAAPRRRVSFGLHPDADYRAAGIEQVMGPEGPGLRFTLECPAGSMPVALSMAGRHNVLNALAAAAAAMACGAKLDAVATGLARMTNVPGRLRRVPGGRAVAVYDDTYNANPGSVRAAIAFLEGLPGERWLVLGDMAELGPDSAAMHREMGELARRSGITRLYCTGAMSQAAAEGFGINAEWRETVPELAELVRGAVRSGVSVLVKGSRSMGMERVVQALTAEGAPPGREW